MEDRDPLVYLVHCESDVLLSLYNILCSAGFRVAASSNALDALGYVARTRPDVVLCHWDMPQMKGPELLKRLRESTPNTRIIISSRNAVGTLYDQVLEAGGDDLLREPFSDVAVVQVVSRMMGRNVPCPEINPVAVQAPGSARRRDEPRPQRS